MLTAAPLTLMALLLPPIVAAPSSAAPAGTYEVFIMYMRCKGNDGPERTVRIVTQPLPFCYAEANSQSLSRHVKEEVGLHWKDAGLCPLEKAESYTVWDMVLFSFATRSKADEHVRSQPPETRRFDVMNWEHYSKCEYRE